jgi:hypothetical protein
VRRISPPLAIALALASLLVVGMVVAAIYVQHTWSAAANPQAVPDVPLTGPVGLAPVDSPDASSVSCQRLLAALPGSLPNGAGKLARRPLANPAPAGTAAWGGTTTTDPVVLRCGIARPDALTPTSELLGVNGVNWLQVTGQDAATWYAVDRRVYVAVTIPSTLSSGPLQSVSAVLDNVLPAVGS